MNAFELIKAEVQNSQEINNIKNNSLTHRTFIQRLTNEKITYQQTLELISLVQDTQVKSLFIIYLLSQKKYLSQLNEPTFLTQLRKPRQHQPSRLNIWARQLNVALLTPELINKLEPEAAISILFSVTQFARLTEEQIQHLIARYPEPEVLTYWITHFATMPNARHMLPHFNALGDEATHYALMLLPTARKEAVVYRMIEDLDSFKTIPKLLFNPCTEDSLILAIKLWSQRTEEKNFSPFINQLVERLLGKFHSFSPAALKSLINLQGNPQFSKINEQLAGPINQLIRAEAKEGNVGLFYDSRAFVSRRACATISLAVPVNDPDLPEHDIIDSLRTRGKTVNALDYFLFHFEQGSKSNCLLLLQQMLIEFLHSYAGDQQQPHEFVNHIALIMSRKELNHHFRQTLWFALLHYPALFSPTICYQLFKFNAEATVKVYGKQGGEENLRKVIRLCNGALTKANPERDEALCTVAQRALREAECELGVLEGGFFTKFFSRFKRCWYYGWNGLFEPNQPKYVTTTHDNPQNPLSGNLSSKKPLNALLQELPDPFDLEAYQTIITGLETHTFTSSKEELAIRKKLHQLYLEWLLPKNSVTVNQYFAGNEPSIFANLMRLIELHIAMGELAEAKVLLTHAHAKSDTTQCLLAELESDYPTLKPTTTEPDTLLKSALSSASELTSSVGDFFSRYVPIPALMQGLSTSQKPVEDSLTLSQF